MTDANLTTASAISEWLRGHMRKGDGLTRPYGRSWENAGRSATKSLWVWPADRVRDLADALHSLGFPVVGTSEGVRVELPGQDVWVAVNRSGRGAGPPDSFSVRLRADALPDFVGNTPEVVKHFLRGLGCQSTEIARPADGVQVGFPGAVAGTTYVGSPEWDIHGEARGNYAVRDAVAATVAAIEEGRSRT